MEKEWQGGKVSAGREWSNAEGTYGQKDGKIDRGKWDGWKN